MISYHRYHPGYRYIILVKTLSHTHMQLQSWALVRYLRVITKFIILHLWEAYAVIIILPDSFSSFRTFSDRVIATELAYTSTIYTWTYARELHYYYYYYYLYFIYYRFSVEYYIYRCIPVDPRSGKITSTVVNLVARRGVWYSVYIWDYIIYRAIRQVEF